MARGLDYKGIGEVGEFLTSPINLNDSGQARYMSRLESDIWAATYLVKANKRKALRRIQPTPKHKGDATVSVQERRTPAPDSVGGAQASAQCDGPPVSVVRVTLV